MTKLKNFSTASMWSLANGIGTRGLSFVFFVVMSRSLSPTDMGLMALAISVTAIADTLADAGLSEAVIRAKSLEDGFLRAVATVQGGLAMAFIMISVPIGWSISNLTNAPDVKWILPVVALATLINALGLCPQAILKRDLRFKEIAIRNLLGTAIGGLVGLVAVYCGLGVWSLVVMHVANALTGFLVCCTAAGWWPVPTLQILPLKEVRGFAVAMTGTRLIETTLSRIDQLVIGSLFGTATLGLYSLAMKLYEVLFQVICGSFSDVLFSRLSSVREDQNKFLDILVKSLRMSAVLGPVVFSLTAIFATTFLPQLFGSQWVEARPYVAIVLGFGVIQSFAFINSLALVAKGLAELRFRLTCLNAILWAITVFGLSPLGALMAPVAWAIRGALMLPINIWFLNRHLNLSFYAYARALLPGLILVALLIAFNQVALNAISDIFLPLMAHAIAFGCCALIGLIGILIFLPGSVARIRIFTSIVNIKN